MFKQTMPSNQPSFKNNFNEWEKHMGNFNLLIYSN